MKKSTQFSQSKLIEGVPLKSTLDAEQNNPLLDKGTEQSQVHKEHQIFIRRDSSKKKGAKLLAVKSSSERKPRWRKVKIGAFALFAVSVVIAIVGSTRKLVSLHRNKNNASALALTTNNSNSALATTTGFAGGTTNPYLKNATSSYSKTVANSSTPSFDEKLKEASRNGDVFSETEFAKYNKSFTELTRLEEEAKLEVTDSYLDGLVELYAPNFNESSKLQAQNTTSIVEENIIESYDIANSYNSTYDEGPEESGFQEDSGKVRNRNRREKVITPVETSALRSFALPHRRQKVRIPVVKSTTSAPISTPAPNPKRYTLVLDPDSPTPSKTGATMEQMQVNVVLKELSSSSDNRARFTPGLCPFLVDEFKSFDYIPNDNVLTLRRADTMGEYLIPINNNISDVIDTEEKVRPECHILPCLRAIEFLGNDTYSLFLDASWEDQSKFLGFFSNERVQRYNQEIAKFVNTILLKYFTSNPSTECLGYPSKYRFENLGYDALNSEDDVFLRFRAYDAKDNTIAEKNLLCDLVKDKLLYLQSVAISKEKERVIAMRAEILINSDSYKRLLRMMFVGAREIIIFKEGRGGTLIKSSKTIVAVDAVSRIFFKKIIVHQIFSSDGSVRLERKYAGYRWEGFKVIPTWTNEANATMSIPKGNIEIWQDQSLTGWTNALEKHTSPILSEMSQGDIRENGEYYVERELRERSKPSIKKLTLENNNIYKITFNASSVDEVKSVYNSPGMVMDGMISCTLQGLSCSPRALLGTRDI